MESRSNLPVVREDWSRCNDPILLQLCGPKWLREPGEEDDPKGKNEEEAEQ